MKKLLITTALLSAPLVSSVSAQSSETLKRQLAEQNRQIVSLNSQISSLQSQLNLERKRSGKTPIITKSFSTSTYTVVAGDSFSKIARNHGIPLASLVAANKGVNPSKIAINQKLVIPQVNGTATTKKSAQHTKINSSSKPSKTTSYTVQKGDTFYGIAKKNGTTAAKLITMNPSVKPTELRPGQKLNLISTTPSKPIRKKASSSKPAPTTKSKTVTQPTAKKTTKPVAKSTVKAVTKKESKQSTTTAKFEPYRKATAKSQTISAPTPKKETLRYSEPTNLAKTVTVNSVTTYGNFAKKNNTTVSALNAMNGLDLPADEPMAVGSALYVPSR